MRRASAHVRSCGLLVLACLFTTLNCSAPSQRIAGRQPPIEAADPSPQEVAEVFACRERDRVLIAPTEAELLALPRIALGDENSPCFVMRQHPEGFARLESGRCVRWSSRSQGTNCGVHFIGMLTDRGRWVTFAADLVHRNGVDHLVVTTRLENARNDPAWRRCVVDFELSDFREDGYSLRFMAQSCGSCMDDVGGPRITGVYDRWSDCVAASPVNAPAALPR